MFLIYFFALNSYETNGYKSQKAETTFAAYIVTN